MKIILSSIFYTLISFLLIVNASASETLSYSGRLVNANGSPVVGPVNLKVELAYSNSPTIIRCSQNFTNIILSNGVFHLNVNFDCGSPVTLSQVLTQIPANESAAIRVTNITDPANPKVYSFQALHSMPFANIAETSKQLVQMEATDGQVLKWDNATARWKPGTSGGGGTVTSVSGTLPITVATGSSTAVISMPVANTSTSGYLSSADWNSFNTKEGTIAGGTALQYYRGDKSWQTLNTSVVPESGVTNLYFSNARVLGVPLDGFVAGPGVIVATDTVLQAFAKTQGQINLINTNSSAYVTKTGTSTIAAGTIDAQAGFVLVGTPGSINDATPRGYVDTQDNLKVNKAGDTMSGVLTLDNDLKMKGGANYVTLKSHATTATYNLFLPQNAGTSGFVLSTDGNGNTTWINSASVANGTDTVTSASIVNDSIVDADINASAAIAQSKIANLSTDLAGKEPTVTNPSDTSKYYRGDKSWQTLNTTAVAEGSNLYFLNARVLGTDLLGLNTGVAGPIVAADTVLGAFGKLQYQVTDLKAKGQWEKNVNDIYYNAGNVGIGTTAPGSKLSIADGAADSTGYGTIQVTKLATDTKWTYANVISGTGVGGFGTVPNTGFHAIGRGNGPTAAGHQIIFRSDNVTTFTTADSERVRINASGNVGVGTATPRSKLEVLGGIQIGADAVTCDATKVGTLRYNAGNVEYCNGGPSWQAFGVTGGGITNINGSTNGTQSFANGSTGTTPAWSTAAGVHTLNIPLASGAGVTEGLITKSDYDAFNSKLGTTLNSGNIWVGNASNAATAVAPSSDVSMTNAGAFTVTKLQGQSVSTTAPVLGSFLKWDNILSQWAPTPLATCSGTNQVMHYILLTDTWSCDTLNVDNLLPTQTANSGKVLTTNGTTTSWQTPAGVTGSGTTNYLPKFTAASTLGDSIIFDNGTKVGVGTNAPVNTLSVFAPYATASSSGSAANGGFRLMNTTDAVVLDMGIGINTTAWLQARDPANYATKKDLLLNPVGGHVTVGGKNTFVSLSTNTLVAANGVLGVIGNDLTSASSYGIMVLANNRTTPAVGDTAGELRLSMNNNAGWRDLAFITSKAEGAGGANGFGGNLLFSLKSDNVNSAPSERMRIASSGNVGINDSAPEGKLSVRGLARGNYAQSSAASYYPFNSAGQGDSFVEIINVNTGYGSPGSFLGLKTNAMSSTPYQRAYIGVVANMGAANYTPDIIIGHQTGATAYQERVRINALGNVGIGTTTPGTGTKLSVEGQIRSKSFTTTSGAIDWQSGNAGTTSFNCATSITFANLRDGGSYTLVVTDTGTTTCSFSTTTTGDDAATVSYRFLPANANRTASTHSVYSLQRIGTIVYVSWMTGF